jgi:hypothetical protein
LQWPSKCKIIVFVKSFKTKTKIQTLDIRKGIKIPDIQNDPNSVVNKMYIKIS